MGRAGSAADIQYYAVSLKLQNKSAGWTKYQGGLNFKLQHELLPAVGAAFSFWAWGVGIFCWGTCRWRVGGTLLASAFCHGFL